MKPYAVLLGVLWIGSLVRDLTLVAMGAPALLSARALGEVLLFGLCLAGCVELAWGRTVVRLSTVQWRLVSNGTFILGGLSVMFGSYGELFGLPQAAGRGGVLQAVLDFLPALVFAIPVVILEHERTKAERA